MVVALCHSHMWIFAPIVNRGGPDGGITDINNGETAGGNPGHDNTGSGDPTVTPCGGLPAFNGAYATAVAGGSTYMVEFIQTDVGISWNVTLALQPDSDLNTNKLYVAQVAGATNTQHTVPITFPNANGVYTVQVAAQSGNSFISCADFNVTAVVATATTSSTNNAVGIVSSIGGLLLSLALAI